MQDNLWAMAVYMVLGIAVMGIVGMVCLILIVLGKWITFEKMDMSGWYAVIPLYNSYKMFEFFWRVEAFVSYLILIMIKVVAWKYYPILGFGKAEIERKG